MSWRDHIKVHPAADLFPMMSEPELRELGEHIKENGQRVQVVLWKEPSPGGEHWLVDGRNRLDAMELVGMPIFDKIGRQRFYWRLMDGDPYEQVLSLNLLRRNLTDEQRRELIAKIIKAKPEASDRAIAQQVKRDHKTVAKVRKKLESTGEVSPVEKRVGADGKKRRGRPPKPKAAIVETLADHPAAGHRVTASPEISIEQRRAESARLDQPSEDTTTEFDKRVNFVVITALDQLAGLSRSEAERFFAALRDRLDDLEREQLRDEVAECRSEYEIQGDLSVPDFLRRAPA